MKLKLSLALILAILSSISYAEKLAIVIDDSAGMCGYLDAPIERNAYKKSLQVLLKARDSSQLDVQAYYLSNLNKTMSLGTTLDQIIRADSKNCPFTATTSPLHFGLDEKKLGTDAIIMVTDLLFDEGTTGSSDSRAALINRFDQFAENQQKNAQTWFNTSAGIIGVKSDFKGTYYSIQGQGKVDFSKQMTERPFYLVWMSKTNQFFPYLNQMTYIWKTPSQANKKLAVESVAAIRLLPITELVAAKQGLFLKPIRNSLLDKRLATPNIYYGAKNNNPKIEDKIQSLEQGKLDNSGKYPIPLECFKTTEQPLQINFSASCAKDGRNQSALFKHKNFPDSVMLSYPLDAVRGVKRIYSVTTLGNGFGNSVTAYYRDKNISQVFSQYKGQYPASLVLHIEDLKTQKSILWNAKNIKDKTLSLNVLEKYQAHSTSEASILPVIKKYWSDIKEPCLEKTADCKKAVSATYQFEDLISSLRTRLNANQRAATLLNQATQPVKVKIVLDENR